MERQELNFKWAAEHIPGFRQQWEATQRVRRETQRYRDNPGYMPSKEVQP